MAKSLPACTRIPGSFAGHLESVQTGQSCCELCRMLETLYSAFIKGFFYNGTFPERL